jgi:hypothetical protein
VDLLATSLSERMCYIKAVNADTEFKSTESLVASARLRVSVHRAHLRHDFSAPVGAAAVDAHGVASRCHVWCMLCRRRSLRVHRPSARCRLQHAQRNVSHLHAVRDAPVPVAEHHHHYNNHHHRSSDNDVNDDSTHASAHRCTWFARPGRTTWFAWRAWHRRHWRSRSRGACRTSWFSWFAWRAWSRRHWRARSRGARRTSRLAWLTWRSWNTRRTW